MEDEYNVFYHVSESPKLVQIVAVKHHSVDISIFINPSVANGTYER